MRLVGIICVLGGWLLAVAGLQIIASNFGRAIFAVAGISVAIFGILAVLNRYYLEPTLWRK